MAHRTRIVHLKSGQKRAEALNAHTVALSGGSLAMADSFRAAFFSHYDVFRAVVEGYRRPGVAIVAVNSDGVAGSACVGAKNNGANVAIIGRHGMADLFLDGDPSLSLRHILVVLHPLHGGDEPRVRLIDLRTAAAFVDEYGRRMEALEAEGPLFIKAGGYLLFFLPTGDETPWPDGPEAGWQCIPERVYLDDSPAEPDRWSRRNGRFGADGGEDDSADGADLCGGLEPAPTQPSFSPGSEKQKVHARSAARNDPSIAGGEPPGDAQKEPSKKPARRTLVQTLSGPSRARRSLLDDDEAAIGRLQIRSDAGKCSILVGRRAASEGVLFGRYERCDNDGLMVLSNGRISRVHVLVLAIKDEIYAVDVASTNGIFLGGKEQRIVKLSLGYQLVLGEQLASLQWQAVSESPL